MPRKKKMETLEVSEVVTEAPVAAEAEVSAEVPAEVVAPAEPLEDRLAALLEAAEAGRKAAETELERAQALKAEARSTMEAAHQAAAPMSGAAGSIRKTVSSLESLRVFLPTGKEVETVLAEARLQAESLGNQATAIVAEARATAETLEKEAEALFAKPGVQVVFSLKQKEAKANARTGARAEGLKKAWESREAPRPPKKGTSSPRSKAGTAGKGGTAFYEAEKVRIQVNGNVLEGAEALETARKAIPNGEIVVGMNFHGRKALEALMPRAS